MRHVDGEDETEMKTSEEFYSFLNLNCKHTLKTIEQKKGKGVYERIFFLSECKSSQPQSGRGENGEWVINVP